MDDIELGVLIPVGQAQWGPGTDPRELLGFAVRAEELGYSSLWVNDFLLTPRVEALTMLAAVAPLTSRVTLGTATLLPVLRRPVQAAQTLASIDLLSGGRLVLTVGAAFPGRFGMPQHVLSDVPWERRFTRLDETVALWRQLWAAPEGGGSFRGALLRFERLPPMTAPARPGGPPVWLGGRDTAAVTPALFVSAAVTGTAEQGRELLATFAEASYGMPLDQLEQIQALAAGPPDVVAEKLRGYVAAGARHLAVRIATTTLESQREQLEQIIKLKGYLR
jgi:alkanesulfonate monooxygenase SsuD/methylene tetrahydromethanopterin reductase-like flavin-dependent oxidoreductase (luciferase family)